jgi:hypothetical protein
MDPLTIALIALRSVGALFALQGKPEISGAINAALDAHQAGRNVDAHLQSIADTLEAGGELDDWTAIRHKIDLEVDDFLDDTGDEHET